MKIFHHIPTLALALGMAGTLTFTACSDDETPAKPSSQYLFTHEKDGYVYNIKDTISYSIEELADLIYGGDGANDDGEREAFINKAKAYDDSLSQAMSGANSGERPLITSDFVKAPFATTMPDKRTLSGAILFRRLKAANNGKQTTELPPIRNVYMMEHEFITDNSDVPSQNNERYIAPYVENDLLMFPDRYAYGQDVDDSHDPFRLKAEVNAEGSRALLKSTEVYYKWMRALLDNESLDIDNIEYAIIDSIKFDKDYKLYAVGLSEGAGVTLAQHKYFDTHPDEKAKWHFAGSICSNGIYNPAKAFETWVKTDEVDNPLLIPLYIMELGLYYDDNNKYFSDVFEEEKRYIDIVITKMDEPLKTKINEIKEALNVSELKPSNILSEAAMDPNSEVYKTIVEKLKEYDLTTGWTPSSPIHLIHADNNKTAPYEIALDAKNLFKGHAECTFTTTSFSDKELKDNAENGTPVTSINTWYRTDIWKWHEYK